MYTSGIFVILPAGVFVLAILAALGVCVSPGGALADQPASPAAAPVVEIQELFKSVRIPNIAVATDGTVLAFAKSGRLLRRSADGGKTWGTVQQVGHDAGGSAIVDRNTGDVMVVGAGRLWRSRDHGKTWKREGCVIKPNAAGHGTPGGVAAKTACSESGITLRYGKHKGRLLMPARIMAPKGSNAQEWWPYHYNTAIYSDDGGKTWQTSSPVQSGTGERHWPSRPTARSTTTPASTCRWTTAGGSGRRRRRS